MKTQNSQEPPPVSAWMEDALLMMELAAEVTAGLAAPAESAQPPQRRVRCIRLLGRFRETPKKNLKKD